MKRSRTRATTIILILAFALVAGSSETFASNDPSQKLLSVNRTIDLPAKLKVLLLEKKEFTKLKRMRKLVFQCYIDQNQGGGVGLIMYKALLNREKRYDSTNFVTLQQTDQYSTQDFSGKMVVLGDQKLILRDVKKMRKAIRKHKVGFFAFVPTLNTSNNHIEYAIITLKNLNELPNKLNNLIILAKTNPSPPATAKYTTIR